MNFPSKKTPKRNKRECGKYEGKLKKKKNKNTHKETLCMLQAKTKQEITMNYWNMDGMNDMYMYVVALT